MQVLTAQINPIVGDVTGNTEKIVQAIQKGKDLGADVVLFSELVLSGYPPEDFLLLDHFIDAVIRSLEMIASETDGIAAIIGAPRRCEEAAPKALCNSAFLIQNKEIVGYQDKRLLPTYDVFDESRYFTSSKESKVWEIKGKKCAVTICEDLWQHAASLRYAKYQSDPVEELAKEKLDYVFNLSASPYSIGKFPERFHVFSEAAETLGCPIVQCNQVGGNDNLIFDGYSMALNGSGELVHLGEGFNEDLFLVDLEKKNSSVSLNRDLLEDLYQALVLGVRDYFQKSGFQKACFGLSGGIDSALVACIAKEALGEENVLAITMPSRYSSQGSVTDSEQLARNLGIAFKELPIEEPFTSFLQVLEPEFAGREPDLTEENLQARIRGTLLMAFSNKFGYIVLSTGNKSETAMGYATLYGDMCGGLGVISDITKLQVYRLAKWINRNGEVIPEAIIEKPPSAELRPDQKDSDSLPDYAIIDNVLIAYVHEHKSEEEIASQFGYELSLVEDLVRRIHQNEYKRRQAAPGLRVSERSFSVGRRFPIVQKWVNGS